MSSGDNLTSCKPKTIDLRDDGLDSIMTSVKKHDSQRSLNHIEKLNWFSKALWMPLVSGCKITSMH